MDPQAGHFFTKRLSPRFCRLTHSLSLSAWSMSRALFLSRKSFVGHSAFALANVKEFLLGVRVGNKEKETSEETSKTRVYCSQGNVEGSSDLGSPAEGDVA